MLRKPFEASVVDRNHSLPGAGSQAGAGTVRRSAGVGRPKPVSDAGSDAPAAPAPALPPDPERIQAAVTLALGAALPSLVVKLPKRFW